MIFEIVLGFCIFGGGVICIGGRESISVFVWWIMLVISILKYLLYVWIVDFLIVFFYVLCLYVFINCCVCVCVCVCIICNNFDDVVSIFWCVFYIDSYIYVYVINLCKFFVVEFCFGIVWE